MRARLNSFQKTMLQWNDLQAYNAVHVVRIAGGVNLLRLRGAIDGSLESRGLTHLTLDRRQDSFAYEGGPVASEIRIISPDADSTLALETEIARQLNTAFEPLGRFNPFRFFVVPDEEEFLLGLVYFHPVADAESIVHLLKRMVDDYLSPAALRVTDPVERYPGRFDNLLLSPRMLAGKICALPALIRNLGRACRLPYRDAGDLNNGFIFFSLKAEWFRSLAASSKSWDVTLNDLFLALLLKSMSFLQPERAQASRRRRITIGCIVNKRKDLALDSRRTFGLFLGSFLVSHEVPEGISLMDLARDVWCQTRDIKEKKLYLTTALEMGIARIATALTSSAGCKKLYPKNYPLWGGITNMNLNSLWDEAGRTRPPDYFRAVSTGPVTPFVVSITTANDSINVGITYRSTVFSRPQVERVKVEFLKLFDQLVRPT